MVEALGVIAMESENCANLVNSKAVYIKELEDKLKYFKLKINEELKNEKRFSE